MFEERGHIGREWVRCLDGVLVWVDGVLVWVEGLELGGRCSGGRARCRHPQKQDRRAAAAAPCAGVGAAWGYGGRRGYPRPTACARGSGVGAGEQRRAGAHASFLPSRSRCGGDVQLLPPFPAPPQQGRPWSAHGGRAGRWGRRPLPRPRGQPPAAHGGRVGRRARRPLSLPRGPRGGRGGRWPAPERGQHSDRGGDGEAPHGPLRARRRRLGGRAGCGGGP